MSLNDLAERIEYMISEVQRLHTRLDAFAEEDARKRQQEETVRLNKEIRG